MTFPSTSFFASRSNKIRFASTVIYICFVTFFLTTDLSPRLTFQLQSEHDAVIKIYFDTGRHYNEDETYRLYTQGSLEWQEIQLTLPRDLIYSLRLDINSDSKFNRLRNINIIKGNGNVLKTIKFDNIVANNHIDNISSIDNTIQVKFNPNFTDPQLELFSDTSIDLRANPLLSPIFNLGRYIGGVNPWILAFISLSFISIVWLSSFSSYRNFGKDVRLSLKRQTFNLNLLSSAPWGFCGAVLIVFYLVASAGNLKGETLEWLVYIVVVVTLFLHTAIKQVLYLRLPIPIQYLVIGLFVVYLWKNQMIPPVFFTRDNRLELDSFVFILAPCLLFFFYYSSSKYSDHLFDLGILAHWFLLFHISSRLMHWQEFYIILEYVYVLPILVFSTIFIGIGLTLKNNKTVPKRLWFVIPLLVFFFESFRTYGLFEKGNGSLWHWQVYVGPLELMSRGGHLLWDVPSIYGFLNLVFAHIIPAESTWQKLYTLNGVLQLAYAMIIFRVLWQQRNVVWYFFSLFLTLALVFYLPGLSEQLTGPAIYPSVGALRFFWLVLTLYVLLNVPEISKTRFLFLVLPVSIIGCLWSVESAFYICGTLGAYFYFKCVTQFDNWKHWIGMFLYFPLSLILIIALISVWYVVTINTIPDYYSFVEHAIAVKQGFKRVPIDSTGAVWTLIYIISVVFITSNRENKTVQCHGFVVSITLCTLFSYFIARSVDNNVTNILVLFVFATIISTQFMPPKSKTQLLFYMSPILIMALTLAFGREHSLSHFVHTIQSQNYLLNDSLPDEHTEVYDLLTTIQPGNTPVIYIESGEAGNFLSKNDYIDQVTYERMPLSPVIWLPFYPATNLEALGTKRQLTYINRWLDRTQTSEGWVINKINDHRNDEALLSIKSRYDINKVITQGSLKATLYTLH